MSKISYAGVLRYSHFDNAHKLIEKNFSSIRTETFDKSGSYEKEYDKLKTALCSSNHQALFYIVSGYSGNGKTTFINWAKNKIESEENVFFDITNLIEVGHGNDVTLNLVNQSIIYDFKDMINADISMLVKLRNNDRVVSHILNDDDTETKWNSLVNLTQYATNVRTIERALKKIDFQELVILYILQHIITNPDIQTKQSVAFCFDNLDEMKLYYLTDKMFEGMKDISSKLRTIFNELNIDFDVEKIHYCLVFREANIACGSAQFKSRFLQDDTHFIYSSNLIQIIRSRRNYAKKSITSFSKDDKIIDDLLDIIEREFNFSGYFIFPLFNYDYRVLINVILDFLTKPRLNRRPTDSMKIDEYFNNFKEEYKYGKRGILINAFIKIMAKHNFIQKIAPPTGRDLENKPHCNRARLMLTVFSNLAFKGGFPQDKELSEIEPFRFSLLEAYRECKEFVDVDSFLQNLTWLIDIDESSWAHLITIYGKSYQEITAGRFTFIEEALLLKKEEEDLSFEEKDKLENIKISMNASAYVFLRHIFTHFEYISAYKLHGKWEDNKPLFLLTQLINGDGENEYFWAFEKKIKEVYEVVEKYTNNTDQFYQETFSKYDKKDFCYNTKYVFKGDYKKSTRIQDGGSLFMSRLITNHINYIEIFRHYITNEGYETLEQPAKANASEKFVITVKSIKEIHDFLLDYIEKYLILLELLNDPTRTIILTELKDKLQRAQKDNSIWVEKSKS